MRRTVRHCWVCRRASRPSVQGALKHFSEMQGAPSRAVEDLLAARRPRGHDDAVSRELADRAEEGTPAHSQ